MNGMVVQSDSIIFSQTFSQHQGLHALENCLVRSLIIHRKVIWQLFEDLDNTEIISWCVFQYLSYFRVYKKPA